MLDMEVWLPGGFPTGQGVERRATFRPLTGRLERLLVEVDRRKSRTAYVTELLSASLECIGSRRADPEAVASLCVADRQFLMLRLAAMLGGELVWLQAVCERCHSMFDVSFRRNELPVVEAGPEFPVVRLMLHDREIEVRVPSGMDQAAVESCGEGEEAVRRLLQSCLLSVDGNPTPEDFMAELSDGDIEAIDASLDEASPAVCSRLQVHCPECGREQQVELDHYAFSYGDGLSLIDEIHTIAMHYHWRESDILDLPTRLRRQYLNLIRQASGTEWAT